MAKPLAVLIVEDSESDAQLIVRLLTKAGYTLTFEQVETGAQMRAALEKQAWEIVISDFSLPEIDGHGALRLLQEMGLDIPFIVVSGTMGEETAVAMMKAGANDYVMKDNLARLAPAVERELSQAEVRRECKQADAALRESEEKYRRLFENTSLGIFQSTPEGKAITVNLAFAHMFGYDSPTDALKSIKNVATDVFADPNRRAEIIRLMAENPGLRTFENLYCRKDGSTFIGSLNSMPIMDANGSLTRIEGIIEDITERKRAEETLRDYNTRLEAEVEERTRELREAQEQLVRHEKLAVLGQLAGGVGHELRNPLAVINNAVYYLKLVQPDANEKVRQYHNMIEQEVHIAEKIITDLLDFARIKFVDREAVAVSELVQSVLARFPLPDSISATLEIPASLPKVFADQRHMEQVLGNLALNAYQAMPKGGSLVIRGEMAVSNEQKFVAVSVRDTGAGIPPENMSKLFEPLFTTKPKGIGLGLAISRKLADANGGRIEVTSEVGKGSTFTVFLALWESP